MAELPALPDGASLDAPADLPPLPAGASLDPHPSDRVAQKEQGLFETAARSLGASGVRAVGEVPYLAGGIAGLVGARDTADTLFGAYEKARAAADSIQGAPQTSVGGRVAQTVGALPVGIATLGAEAIPESGASVIRDGGSVKEALGQTALNTAATAAAAGIGGLGKTTLQRVTQQGIASGTLGQVARVAGNAMRGEDQQEAFDPVQLGIDIGTGVGFGFVPHGHAPVQPKPDVLGITHQPDFITDAQGRTINNKGDQTLGQPVVGGAGLDQQAPGGPPSPVIPPEPAALALTHQPDVTVDSQGRAVMNKGDRTLGQPVGGAFEEQAPLPKPAGPLTAALEAGGVKPPPEAAAPAIETPPVPATDNSGAAAATPPAKQTLRDQYAARQAEIDQINAQRKSGTLAPADVDRLHDLRDVQDSHDPLTGLLNQKGYDDAVKSGGFTHAAALDLDQFKPINDTFGHAAGDTILQHVAQVLHDSSEGNVTVARLHGDEYAGLAKGDPTEAMAAAQKNLRETPFTIDYVDKAGNTHTHTFDGIGITFGVGDKYETADAAANAAKPKTGRRNSDQNEGSVRPEDVQATSGSVGDGSEGGRQADLSGDAGQVSEPAPTTPARGAGTDGESRSTGAVQHAEDSGAAAVRGGDGNERDAARRALAEAGAEGQRTGVGNTREQRIAQSEQDHFNNLASEVGWDQVGGKLLREADRSDGLKSEVTGRTQWVGKHGFLGESQLWRGRPDKRLKESQALEAFRKQAAGEPLKPIEQRFIDHARKTAQIYAHAEESARQEEADRRGFASVDAMHEHDANNFVGGEYNGEPREDIPFSRGGKQGMSRASLQSAISDTLSGWKGDAPRVQVHQAHEDAPASLRNSIGFDRSVEGAYDPRTNTVHLFGDAIATPKRAAQVLAHEVIGHYGIEAVVGKQWPKLVRDLNAMRERAPASMKAVLDEVARRYPGADADTFASEAMAVMAEKDIRNSFMDRVITAVRQFLRAQGFDTKFSDAELRQMLVAASRRVAGEKFSGQGAGALAFSKRDGGASADMFGGAEKPRAGSVQAKPATGDLFGGATSRDHVDAAVRSKDEALSGKGTAVTMRQGDGELFAGPRPKQTLFSKRDEDKPSIGYAGDRHVQRDRLAERKFDKPYAQLSADDKADVDSLFQTTSAAKNPMFSKADREDKPQVESDAFKKWSNDAPFVDRVTAATREFKSGEKVVVEAYHGTQRPDRIADVFKRNRATSGPMAYFTSDPELASSYSHGKTDTSLANEDSNYESWFKYQPKGERTPMNIDRAWYRLSPEQRATISERAGRVHQDDDGKIVLGPEGQTSGLGGFDQHMRETQRGYDKSGNPLKALVEEWLNSGALFNDEERFEDVLKLAGFPTHDVKFDSPHASYPFVYKTFIEMQRPLVASDIPADVMKALDDAAKRARTKPAQYGADAWDKRTRDFKEWVGMLKGDDATHAWTSIPDKATEVFKSLGYDGIIDKSGKTFEGAGKHPVYIPFEESQVKSAISNKGTFDAAKKNIRFSKADAADTEPKPAESFLDKATGVLRPNKAELAARALKAVALQGRELARGISRAAWAQRDRAVGQADAAIDAFRSHFDARPADVRGDALKSYEPIIAYQQGKTIADPVAKKFADTFADLFARQAAEIRKFGEDKLGLLDQYFPQLWEDPGRAEKMYADMAAKRPLAGNKSFTKERVFADYEQGIKAGMKPAFDNPADALMARYQSGERYLSALRIKDGVDKLGMLQDIGQGDRVPPGFARVNDNSFAGKVVPEMVARDLNNYLAPGLSQFKAWRTFRWAQNALLSMRLGFSFFHAGFTTVDSAMTHLDLGMRRALSGDIAGAVKHLAQIPLTPIHAVQGLFGKGDGAKLVRQFYGKEVINDPHTAAVLDALTQGGARGRMDPTDYNNDFAQTLRAFKTDGAKALAKTPLKTFGAVIEGAMRPIAHNLVPAQKMTARVELMKHELDRVAEQLGQKKGDYAAITKAMNETALRQIAHSVVQRVDDRLGQLAYDNLFWNRTVKDILQASIQSVGWNVGTKNVIFGGLGDVKKIFNPEKLLAPLDKEGKITDATMSRVTGRLSYLVALNLGVGALGGITQYLLTGEGPTELKDYFFPKTGNKNPDGTDARISFPSYVKDEFGFARHPIDTVQHKLHPSFSMVAELLNNKDFYGNEVYNPDDPWTKVAAQVAGHIAGGFVPYAAQNRSQVAAAGGGIGAQVAPFVGITPAPGSETHSDAQNYISQAYYAAHPSESKTPDKAAHSKEFTSAIAALRTGQTPDLTAFTAAERAKIQKYAKEDPATLVQKHFAALPLQQQLAAYDKASAAERAQYKMRATIIQKSGRQLANETDAEQRERMRARVNQIRMAN